MLKIKKRISVTEVAAISVIWAAALVGWKNILSVRSVGNFPLFDTEPTNFFGYHPLSPCLLFTVAITMLIYFTIKSRNFFKLPIIVYNNQKIKICEKQEYKDDCVMNALSICMFSLIAIILTYFYFTGSDINKDMYHETAMYIMLFLFLYYLYFHRKYSVISKFAIITALIFIASGSLLIPTKTSIQQNIQFRIYTMDKNLNGKIIRSAKASGDFATITTSNDTFIINKNTIIGFAKCVN